MLFSSAALKCFGNFCSKRLRGFYRLGMREVTISGITNVDECAISHGRESFYRSRSISRGPITISNAGLTESDVIPVLNKESFRTWQFMRPPRELGGDRNDVSAFRVYSTVCLHL